MEIAKVILIVYTLSQAFKKKRINRNLSFEKMVVLPIFVFEKAKM